jgi:hypothetical protein
MRAETSATECGSRQSEVIVRCSAVSVIGSGVTCSFVVTMVSMSRVMAERVRPPVRA